MPSTVTHAELTAKYHKKLLALVVATGISPKSVFDGVIAEMRQLFPGRRKVNAFLDAAGSFESYLSYEARTVEWFASYRGFHQRLKAANGAGVLRHYMQQWLAAELFFCHRKAFKQLPASYK